MQQNPQMHMHRTNTLSIQHSKRIATAKEKMQKPLSSSVEDSTTIERKQQTCQGLRRTARHKCLEVQRNRC